MYRLPVPSYGSGSERGKEGRRGLSPGRTTTGRKEVLELRTDEEGDTTEGNLTVQCSSLFVPPLSERKGEAENNFSGERERKKNLKLLKEVIFYTFVWR